MGGPGTSTDFSLKAPVGVVVETDQPDFRWRPLSAATAYQVTVADDRQNVVAQSGSITKMEWRPDKPLSRNQIYQWQVVALKDGQELAKAPDAGGASAKFQIISRKTYEQLERARQLYPGSPLTLGVLYAQAGFLEDAEAQFQALVKTNPRSSEARKLLADVRKMANVQKLRSAPQ